MKEKNITIADVQIENPHTTVKAAKDGPKKREKRSDKVKEVLTNKKLWMLLGSVLITVVAVVAILYSIFAIDSSAPESVVTFNKAYLAIGSPRPQQPVKVTLTEPAVPRTKINPINGVLLTEEEFDEYADRNPVAAMVNNHIAARPHSGLIFADIIYEAIAESGITRYMPVYWSNVPEKIGPIRSVRQYYIEWLSEYDAIFIHDGYASSPDPRIDAGGNLYRYDIKTISTRGAWRDNTRYAPHNEYSSIKTALEIGVENGWTGLPSDFEAWEFGPDAPRDERGRIKTVTVVPHQRLYNGGVYNGTWEYNIDTNTFLRTVGSTPSVDQETDIQLEAKTVILQKVEMIPSGDEKAHNIITTMGEGEATIFMNGKKHEVNWKKPSRTERTTFYDLDGKEFVFNRGLVWITALSTTDGSFDIIEQ